jgi:signal transduction histidine kinase
MTLAAIGSGRRFSERDLVLAEEVARRTAVAIDNAQLYARAQRATRARENTLAIVSHDLRNPLSSVLMALTLLLRIPERRKPPVLVAELERIVRGANRMNRLIQDLLDTASIDAGHLSVEPSALDVTIEVFEALEAVRPLADGKSLRLDSDLPKDLPLVFGDGPRLQQVFGNLLGNATKFTPTGGTITIGATRSGDVVTFSVADTGPGIAAAELPRLFDRFWQAPRTARLGTGLGLFIAQGIVEAHGGKLWVESELGVGSTFFFTLPACHEPIAA